MIEVVRYDTTRTSEWDAFVSKSKMARLSFAGGLWTTIKIDFRTTL